jgi:hypothetical protein
MRDKSRCWVTHRPKLDTQIQPLQTSDFDSPEYNAPKCLEIAFPLAVSNRLLRSCSRNNTG